MPVKNKVFVGLSGGVDSAVSAALLKEQGYDVTGVFIKIWQPEFIECTWREDRLDAMRVAAALDIPFRELDLSGSYQREVIEPMIASYKRGETPNPDIVCNEKIKFDAFAQWVHSEGAQFVATGHYARIIDGQLYRGTDTNKDQSYFLYRIPQGQLARTLFPIGHMEKPAVREKAMQISLPNANRRDSQGLCFVGSITMREFLARYITLNDGDVINMKREVVGRHNGAPLYTIGARHGFTIFGDHAQEGAHFVIATSVADNTITVSTRREDAALGEASIRDQHWIGEQPPVSTALYAQSRYREDPFPVHRKEDRVIFSVPRIVTPGQSLVLYDNDRVIGGGIVV